ncbi:hypothetical protein [Streptomyces sp. PT12]|uniref:hypothetical protein n=1 Tax=Streptomyces sp. PT12 TaxID=1510197 RepID=UPI00215D1557|nr:hypothetical protein [Streptomyces sp. PT12]
MKETDVTTPGAPKRAARARNRRGEGGRLREHIVDAAAALLDETGDERAITLRSVARRIGIAPLDLRALPDQPAIMLAVVRREFAALEAHLRAVPRRGVGDLARRVPVGRASAGRGVPMVTPSRVDAGDDLRVPRT